MQGGKTPYVGPKEEVVAERGRRLMRMIDERLGGEPETQWMNNARIRILGVLLEEIELAISEAKEKSF